MRAIDTNVLVRLVTGDDARQTAVAESFVSQGDVWVSQLVLVEMTWVLETSYGLTAQEIADSVQMLLDHKNLTIQEADTIEAALARYRRKPSLGFTDCLVLESARKAGHLPLGTFDRDLGRQDGGHLLHK